MVGSGLGGSVGTTGVAVVVVDVVVVVLRFTFMGAGTLVDGACVGTGVGAATTPGWHLACPGALPTQDLQLFCPASG